MISTPEVWDCQDLVDDLFVIAEIMREDYERLGYLMNVVCPDEEIRGYGMADDVEKAAKKLNNLVERLRLL
jgi:hypothetical protein